MCGNYNIDLKKINILDAPTCETGYGKCYYFKILLDIISRPIQTLCLEEI